MTLENLLKIGQLKSHATDSTEIRRLLDAARRNLADAHVEAISPETRFDAAYKAIMQTALVALMAQGLQARHEAAGTPHDGIAVLAGNDGSGNRPRARARCIAQKAQLVGLHG